MVTSHHGPAYLPKNEYGLGTKHMMVSMTMLKISDMWIADLGASNHVTFSDKGYQNKRNMIASTHGIVGSIWMDIPCVYLTKMEIKWKK